MITCYLLALSVLHRSLKHRLYAETHSHYKNKICFRASSFALEYFYILPTVFNVSHSVILNEDRIKSRIITMRTCIFNSLRNRAYINILTHEETQHCFLLTLMKVHYDDCNQRRGDTLSLKLVDCSNT